MDAPFRNAVPAVLRRRTLEDFHYLAPTSLDQALDFLSQAPPGGKILNGGTDLVVQMKQGVIRPPWVMDIKQVPELHHLEYDTVGGLRIGAAVTINRLLAQSSLPKAFDLLRQACLLIGSVQIKNRATVAGNICNAAPSADAAPPLMCLDAKAKVASQRGIRSVDVHDFFLGPGRTVLLADEMVVEIHLPAPVTESAGCYLRHTTREEMDIAVVGVGVRLDLEGRDRNVSAARIAVGAAAPVPLRTSAAESRLLDRPPTRETIAAAARQTAAQASPISDVRGSAGYRRDLLEILTRRALMRTCAGLGIQV